MARRTISLETKNAVLAALALPEANVAEISKQFGLSLPTVYKYRKELLVVSAPTVEA